MSEILEILVIDVTCQALTTSELSRVEPSRPGPSLMPLGLPRPTTYIEK